VAEQLGAVLAHLATEQTVRERAVELLAELKERLLPELVEATLAKRMDFDSLAPYVR
jgi:hypothetical protein